jgi:hypothetical protein
VARIKGVDQRTVITWIATGRLAAIKAGRDWWTTKPALEHLTPARKRGRKPLDSRENSGE